MPQQQDSVKPLFLNLDSSFETMQKNESPFIKDWTWQINGNANLPTGTGNPSGEGQNEFALTPSRGNQQLTSPALPSGFNKCVGSFESTLTKENYYFNYNDNGNHGIYVISGDDLSIQKVVVDSNLNFTEDQESYFSEHRVTLRVRYDENKNIIEKYLIATNGNRWQLWIDVLAAIATDGYNTSYYTLQPPLFDRRELLEYPVRPPMQEITAVSSFNSGLNTINNVVDTAFEFCYQFVLTDGRESVVAPFSVPYIIQTESFSSNSSILPNEWILKLYAGSCLVEKINIFYRYTKKQQDVNSFVTWSDWYLYDTIFKFGTNIPNQYWTRTNEWAIPNYNPEVTGYDSTNNILSYVFDNTKLGQITDQSLFALVQSGMPIKSVGLSDLGDSILLGNNQYGYDNIPTEITNKINVSVQEGGSNACVIPTKKVRLYGVVVGGVRGVANDYFQVGYYNSADSIGMRIGGVFHDGSIELDQSADFKMTFGSNGENNAYVCYFKGTPYYSVGKWYQVNSDYSLVPILSNLDYSNAGTKPYINSVISNGGFFVCVFDFEVPSGIYMACIGRHNVSLNNDFRGQSSYVLGLTTSTLVKSNGHNPNTFSKEMYVDCTSTGNYDQWGNTNDCFLLFTPFTMDSPFHFTEGYVNDDRTHNSPYELLATGVDAGFLRGGRITDKNGFYWNLCAGSGANSNTHLYGCFTCGTPSTISITGTCGGDGWCVQSLVYVQDIVGISYNINVNTFLYTIKITDSTGLIPYSNISVTLSDGSTKATDVTGNATFVFHNPSSNSARGSIGNVMVSQNYIIINGASNFVVTEIGCGYISGVTLPSLTCSTTQQTIEYPTYPLAVNIVFNQYTSLKQQGSYSIGAVLADLAGRVTSVQKITDIGVPSFVSRQDTKPTYFQWTLSSGLNLNTYPTTKDAAYLGLFVTKAINYKKYIQWVGDSIVYYNASGNVVTDTALATYCAISMMSLLDANIKNNLNLLATYQFQQNDRLRVYDNGSGQLLSAVIDVPITGTNYNQAAINSQLIAPPTNTVLPSTTPTASNVNIFVEYDSRFDQLKGKTGFWIEIYSPSETTELTPFYQAESLIGIPTNTPTKTLGVSWIPIIDGELAIVDNGTTYNPTTGSLNYWDTYLFPRNIAIPNAGVQFFNHPFESPNVTDTWGVNAASGGQPNIVNPYAKQMFYLDDTIKSDDYISQGLKNGLATFRGENKKTFKGYGRGGIVAIKTHYQVVFFLCENDWFVTDFNFNYVYANAQGVQIANLDNAMGTPHQKIGDNYGCSYGDTSSIVFNDKYAIWHDKRNEGFMICNFSQASDITDIQSEGRSYGIKSYYCKKSLFVSSFNETHNTSNKIDVLTGIDIDLNLLYVTFRPRRNNSNDLMTFVNNRRNLQINYQETFVYNINVKRWVRLVGFTPEGYGTLRGNSSGRLMLSFAGGVPYFHGNIQNSSFCNFYGKNVAPVLSVIINPHPESEKTLQNISLDINNQPLWVDMIYSNLLNNFSYIPINYMKEKEGQYYAPLLSNMNSYSNPNTRDNDFRSMLIDGGKIRGVWFLVRFVADLANIVNGTNVYSELNDIFYKYTVTGNQHK